MTNYIIKTPKPAEDLKRINDYFLTFLGEIKLPRLLSKLKNLFYPVLKTILFPFP